MKTRIIPTIILAAALAVNTGCATTTQIDRQGIHHTATPPADAGLTTRTILIEIGKILAAAAGAYGGTQLK